MNIPATTGPADQNPLAALQRKLAARKTKGDDPYLQLEKAAKAAKQTTEQTKRLGPPVDIKDPREIVAGVTGRNHAASLVDPKDRQKDPTASTKSVSLRGGPRDSVELKTARNQVKAR